MLDLVSALLFLLAPALLIVDDYRLETEPEVHYRKCDSEFVRKMKEVFGR